MARTRWQKQEYSRNMVKVKKEEKGEHFIPKGQENLDRTRAPLKNTNLLKTKRLEPMREHLSTPFALKYPSLLPTTGSDQECANHYTIRKPSLTTTKTNSKLMIPKWSFLQ
ncbi:hypothetical protein Tco_1181252 [Tanacetum coccineum]